MLKTATALSAILALGVVGAATAQEATPGVSGTIQSIDEGTRTVVLDDGQSYVLSADQHVSTLREGTRINLSCDDAMTNCMVSESGTTGESGPTGQSETPESQIEPSAGSDSGGDTTTTPSTEAGSGESGGNTDGSGTDGGSSGSGGSTGSGSGSGGSTGGSSGSGGSGG